MKWVFKTDKGTISGELYSWNFCSRKSGFRHWVAEIETSQTAYILLYLWLQMRNLFSIFLFFSLHRCRTVLKVQQKRSTGCWSRHCHCNLMILSVFFLFCILLIKVDLWLFLKLIFVIVIIRLDNTEPTSNSYGKSLATFPQNLKPSGIKGNANDLISKADKNNIIFSQRLSQK